MFAKTPLILTLLVNLLFATQAQRVTLPVEMKSGGACATKQCAPGCCTNKACCKVTERQKAPPAPAAAPQYAHLQLAAIGLHAYTLLFLPPAPRRPVVILDDTTAAHTLSPRAVSCIRLI